MKPIRTSRRRPEATNGLKGAGCIEIVRGSCPEF